ncbi:MAG: phytanoyl-CoA dioxygenase family protein [Actinomycetota bacterium]|nr:phytanoyl-CoA dioxygenase family protein [Actinomycetota bacterium]
MAPVVSRIADTAVPDDAGPRGWTDVADAFDIALLCGPGFGVFRQVVASDLVESAVRLLNLEIVRSGLTPTEIARCSQSTFFPHLRWDPDVLEIRTPVERLVAPRPGEEWAEAQLLLRFPDEAQDWPLTPHVDGLPPWAQDRCYRAIVGVALSPSKGCDGCVAVWPGSHAGRPDDPRLVELEPGDVVVMHPALRHSSTLNTGGRVRYAIYFRLLTAPSSNGGVTDDNVQPRH